MTSKKQRQRNEIRKHLKPQRKVKKKIDKSKQNAGGWYEGMPGVTVNQHGHRTMVEFIVTEEGESKCIITAHPKLVQLAIENTIADNKMIRQVLVSAVVEHVFNKPTIWNWVLRKAYTRWFKRKQRLVEQTRAIQRAHKEAHLKKQQNQMKVVNK